MTCGIAGRRVSAAPHTGRAEVGRGGEGQRKLVLGSRGVGKEAISAEESQSDRGFVRRCAMHCPRPVKVKDWSLRPNSSSSPTVCACANRVWIGRLREGTIGFASVPAGATTVVSSRRGRRSTGSYGWEFPQLCESLPRTLCVRHRGGRRGVVASAVSRGRRCRRCAARPRRRRGAARRAR